MKYTEFYITMLTLIDKDEFYIYMYIFSFYRNNNYNK